jgi:hypothetical protein
MLLSPRQALIYVGTALCAMVAGNPGSKLNLESVSLAREEFYPKRRAPFCTGLDPL